MYFCQYLSDATYPTIAVNGEMISVMIPYPKAINKTTSPMSQNSEWLLNFLTPFLVTNVRTNIMRNSGESIRKIVKYFCRSTSMIESNYTVLQCGCTSFEQRQKGLVPLQFSHNILVPCRRNSSTRA
jgi:hypothetical protein